MKIWQKCHTPLLLYTDRDSLILAIRSKNTGILISQVIQNHTHFIYDASNKKVKKLPGKFKDELNRAIISEVIGLRSKMYSFETASEDRSKNIQKAKG